MSVKPDIHLQRVLFRLGICESVTPTSVVENTEMKRGYHGTYHKMSPKHLIRYVTEFAGCYSDRNFDTEDQMGRIAQDMVRKRLKYKELTAWRR